MPARREARIQQQHVQLAVACNDRVLAQGCGERAHRAQIREVERRLGLAFGLRLGLGLGLGLWVERPLHGGDMAHPHPNPNLNPTANPNLHGGDMAVAKAGRRLEGAAAEA